MRAAGGRVVSEFGSGTVTLAAQQQVGSSCLFTLNNLEIVMTQLQLGFQLLVPLEKIAVKIRLTS